ncbi:hypothetical protein G7Y79_00054g089010 [Physcia stellaris]|nr:hypothetical protein G7Y79_00054g089010 [Physcia stellaris]
MHSFQVFAFASALMTLTSALPRFPFAALFERNPQYEAISSFPTLTLASATGIVPSGTLTGSGTFGAFPTGTGTGLPFFPNITFTGVASESVSSFSIATSISVEPVKVPRYLAPCIPNPSINSKRWSLMPGGNSRDLDEESHTSCPRAATFGGALNAYAFDPGIGNSPTKQDRVLNGSPIKKAKQPPRPTPKKLKRTSSGYAPPSKYAHLVNNLVDSLGSNLLCLFIGLNPGLRTASTGHAYNHPSNLFWKLLHSSGCTPRRCQPEEDRDMPRLYELGLTNIVERPTKDGSELSKDEMDAGVAVLEMKIARDRPEVVAIVGKSIWESIWRVRHGKKITKEQFRYGWQDDSERMGVVAAGDEPWEGARVFVATTTSGLAAGMRPHEKEEVWRRLGEWVERRRAERLNVAPKIEA